MAISALSDSKAPPSRQDLADVLGGLASTWASVHASVEGLAGPLTDEWKHYGKASGWVLRLKSGKRTLVYLAPQDKHFLAAVTLGEKAVAAAKDSTLSDATKDAVAGARKYVEGRSIRINVRDDSTIADIVGLIRLKLAS
ncbi:MAG: DUF3788 family protein [Opitutales bacterium]|jgi:hypothetical protein